MGEVLNLVAIEVMRPAIGFGNILSGQGSQGKLCHNERPEEGTDIGTEGTLR